MAPDSASPAHSGKDPERQPAASREEVLGALFPGMIAQLSTMALMFLGQIPNPETGKSEHNLDGARLFIDQLEMIAIKTKGNLTPEENRLLQETLTMLRLAFVETTNAGKTPTPPAASTPPTPAAPGEPASPPPSADNPPAPASDPGRESSPKRFTKKY
ncbi:MAG TPA: DUF1844 domain-containing protein [Methylomirabilota bacterium]|nr:DUF1844 domain-containing protein [Methylomirabilota bacterium]